VSPLPDDATRRRSPEDEAEYHRLFDAEYEAALDAGHGACLLRNRDLAQQVEATLAHDDGVRYELIAYVIMPNHVHVLFALKPETALEKIVQAWKGVSARAINHAFGVSGSLWQAGYWDRLIRNRKHFERVRDYVRSNPGHAHLPDTACILRELRTVSDSGELVRLGSKDTPVLGATTGGAPGQPGTGASPLPGGAPTPCFVVDAAALERNLDILATVKRRTGCRILLALKAFSMFSVFPRLRRVLDGCCASSAHEARLGREEFGGEVHAFAAAFSEDEMREVAGLADHVTLNSFAQLRLFQRVLHAGAKETKPTLDARRPTLAYGLRINPEHSEGHTELYDPCAPNSRLGVRRAAFESEGLDGLTGLHCHTLCEQNAEPFARTVAAVEERFGDLLPRLSWMNFGGGHHITRSDYNLDLLCDTLNAFRRRHPNIETLYLEPGEACALNAGTLVATVLDVVENGLPVAILDASCACHMPDVLEMPYRPRVFRDAAWRGEAAPGPGADCGGASGEKPYTVRLAGASCLAGDIIGDWSFDAPLKPGDRVVFEDMAHYTMVKTNTFNGIRLPSIMVRETDGAVRLVRSFGYADFKSRLS
jgi:carboxynorspermidine decarboxylase